MDKLSVLNNQLQQTCKLTGACWAAWLKYTGAGWDLGLQTGLNKTRRSALIKFIQQPQTTKWLSRALISGRVRSRKTGKLASNLGCERTYLFSSSQTQSSILVGANQLSRESQGFFRVVIQSEAIEQVSPEIPLFEQSFAPLQEIGGDINYNPQAVFIWALDILRNAVPCQAAFIAVRVGDIFRIEANWNYSEIADGFEISIKEDRILSEMIFTRQGCVLSDIQKPLDFVINNGLQKPVRSCMALPITLGRRVIGLFVCVSYRSKGFEPSDLIRLQGYLERVPQAIENAMLFKDLARYLQQFALLTEMAVSASRALDLDDVVQRVLGRLRSTFRTELVAVLLLSNDGTMLHELGGGPYITRINFPVSTSLSGYVAETGYPIRVGDIQDAPRFLDELSGVHSAMAVPMKYRGKVIGVLAVESTDRNAFTLQDEQLLVVVASHLTILLENVHLLQELRERADKLTLIHQVVQRIVGLLDVKEIAAVTAELIAKFFNYDFAIVQVLDENDQYLVNLGIGGTQSNLIPYGFRYHKSLGITGYVIHSGKSYLSNDVSQDPKYVSIPGWEGGSELCVPLHEGEHVLGLINLERAQKHSFSEEDVLMFESLAGVVASVMMNARRYQELQVRVGHLQAARETALDISADLDLDVLFKRVVRRAKELARAKGAALGLIENEGKRIRVVLSENPWYPEDDYIIPFGEGIVGRTANFGETFRIDDYFSWDGRPDMDFPVEFKAAAGVPLKLKNEILGALVVMDDHPDRTFRDDDVQVLELLAPQVAVSIHNARLYQELQEQMEVRRQTEVRLLRSARLAAIGEMAAGVAHELNNPLTTVIGFVNLALEELPDDLPQKSDLTLVLKEANRARSVVRRLLDFSRKTENIRTPTDLNSLVDEVVALVRHPAQFAGAEFRLELDYSLPKVQVDPDQIKQVLLNLLQNGIQAMPDGGILTLSSGYQLREGRSGVAITVKDTGEGIPADDSERIFDPFFTTRPVGEGTGLGLFVSYGIVSDHGGDIDFESQPGTGSCFTVWLPLAIREWHE